MNNFYIQSEYSGIEISILSLNLDRSRLFYSKLNKFEQGMIPVGSVEFVEEHSRIFAPNYYPDFLKDHFHRKIYFMESLSEMQDDEFLFVKPADRHKRFDALIVHGLDKYDKYDPVIRKWQTGPYWASEVVNFTDEWRYYVALGEVLTAEWYLGKEEEMKPPELNIEWPADFCGAVDFGRLSNGKIALVENNLPYACGWYGDYAKGALYIKWLEAGWDYVNK